MDPATLSAFFDICDKLKKTKRTGWVYRNVSDPESVADHSWRVAMMAFFIEDPFVDKVHCMKMGLIHDLAESLVGDITPVDNVTVEDKHAMEKSAFQKIVSDFPQPLADELVGLWQEYEDQQTIMSHYVFDFDKLDMLIQANQYEMDQGVDLQEFFDSTAHLFKTPYGKSQIALLQKKREERLRNNREKA
ncbi:HD domain-containing protein 2-like protein [Blastocystis sp. ATCC 50177/Nand II]|uniref:5'-deoxynucleotidase n=1 Tax=Blastocystis sp. subtype 1 (strain ATCC 50177 / NandII) TaxID=478820 RepID=A0A196S763_BLAHN|nr:HD domain-containing protein 2-like protein [Blastocystis sp. ATCC 50177/Nand II]